MKALLLAAGLGTRLRPLTEIIPKCLIPVHGLPLLMWWVESLVHIGVNEIYINIHYKHDLVKKAFQLSPYNSKINLLHEDNLLGTGGTLLHNKASFGSDDIMVIHADNLSSCPLDKFVERHKCRPPHTIFTMMTFKTPTPTSCGIVELDSTGIVIAFHEKVITPPGNLANAAVYIFSPEIYSFLEKLQKPFIDLSTEVIPHFIGQIQSFHNTYFHEDLGNLKTYKNALKTFDFPFTPSWTPDHDWWDNLLNPLSYSKIVEILEKTP